MREKPDATHVRRGDAHEPIGHAHPELDIADAPPPETSDEAGGLDLLSIGLAVFFVALIVTVGAMLLLPRLVSGG